MVAAAGFERGRYMALLGCIPQSPGGNAEAFSSQQLDQVAAVDAGWNERGFHASLVPWVAKRRRLHGATRR
jgi:hypothetical protein